MNGFVRRADMVRSETHPAPPAQQEAGGAQPEAAPFGPRDAGGVPTVPEMPDGPECRYSRTTDQSPRREHYRP